MRDKLKRNLSLLHVFSFLRYFAFWQPIEQLFVFSIGGDEAVIGIGLAVWAVTLFVFEIPSGYLADRWGKKTAFYISAVTRIIAFCLIAMVSTVSAYYVSLCLLGVAVAFISGSDKALLHDTLVGLKQQSRYRQIAGRLNGLAIVGVVVSGGIAIGIAKLGYTYSYAFSIIPQLFLLVVVWLLYEPPVKTTEQPDNPIRDVRTAVTNIITIRALQLLVLLAGTTELIKRIDMQFGQVLLLAALGSSTLVPTIWVLGAVMRAVSNFTAHLVKLSADWLVALTVAGFLAMAFGPRPLVPWLYVLLFLPLGIVLLQAEEAAQKVAPPHLRATTLSGMQMLISLLQVVPMVCLGWLMSRTDVFVGLQITGLVLVAVLGVMYIKVALQRRALSPVIAYTEMGNKHGIPLVYIHGWGCSKQDFASAAKNKRLRQYRLIAFDFPGCGESSYAGKLTADDMVTITHRLLVDLKASPAVLVGHSIGGALATRYAERFPAETLGIVSVAGNMIAEDCKLTRKVASETKKNLQQGYNTWVTTMKSSKNPGWRAYGQTLEKWTNPTAYHNYARLIVRQSERGDLLPLFSRLPIPKLFLYCQNDQSSPKKLQALKGNGVETKAIPRSQHFPGYDNPTYYYRVLADFMHKVTSSQHHQYET